MLRTFSPLFICAAVVTATRFNIESSSLTINAVGMTENKTVSPDAFQGVAQFQTNCGNEDAAKVVGALLNGIHEAGHLDSSVFQFELSKLTVELRVKEYLYGEIASKSRMPIFWVLEPTVTFTCSPGQFVIVIDGSQKTVVTTEVEIHGLYAMPSAQGISLYENFMNEAMLQLEQPVPENEKEAMAVWQPEVAAAFTYLKNHWWGSKRPKRKPLRDAGGKLSKIFLTAYDIWKYRTAVGSDFGMIFYQLCTVTPARFTSFVFFKDSNQKSRMYFTTEEQVTADGRYQQYHLGKKSEHAGLEALVAKAKLMSFAELTAKSGINFGKSMSYGNVKARLKMGEHKISAGSPEAIANLLTRCASAGTGDDPQCSGSTPGRVAWGTVPSSRMCEGEECKLFELS